MDFFFILLFLLGSRDSSVGIAIGYGLDYREVMFRSWQGQEYSLLHVVQTGSRAH
jgi:hypothetical protein